MNERDDVKFVESKSYLYFSKKLYPLTIMAINKDKQPVYYFAFEKEITEHLIDLDYFLIQFYRYNQADEMTTVKFGLSGFTEALGAYNKYCR